MEWKKVAFEIKWLLDKGDHKVRLCMLVLIYTSLAIVLQLMRNSSETSRENPWVFILVIVTLNFLSQIK